MIKLIGIEVIDVKVSERQKEQQTQRQAVNDKLLLLRKIDYENNDLVESVLPYVCVCMRVYITEMWP